MRCFPLTGKCQREATHLVVVYPETEDERLMCTQHTNACLAALTQATAIKLTEEN